jgi:hypothetical protein
VPDLKNTLPWKVELVVIPVQSLSSGEAVVVESGILPYGASTKFRVLFVIL